MNIVIVEDDINMRKSLEIALSDYEQFTIKAYKSATEAIKKIDESVDLIITDINMPGMDGLEFIKALDGKFDVIVITGNATLNRAIQSVRLGVKDFLTKPFEIQTLLTAINRTKTLAKKQPKKPQKTTQPQKAEFLSTSENLQKTLNLAKKAAATDVNVMIIGESGVGKELFANFIHENSKRKNAPFVAINMAAIPENLLESELYGYEKGAFTDANSMKKGLFELASGGTLFLDEIGEMPLNLQPKLLRALQEREIVRLGSTKGIKIDVRILCATNANLQQKVKNGEFREDLFYRLNTLPLFIPPLRDRKDEILPIAEQILSKVSNEYELGKKKLLDEAKNELLSYNYPGNIRELISIIERAAILSDGENIYAKDLFIYAKH